jgi:GT2 family glycosyltransferase
MPELKAPNRPVIEAVTNGVAQRRPIAAFRESAHYAREESQPMKPPQQTLPAGVWESTPDQPEFLLHRQIPAGWMEVRFEIETKAGCLVEIYLDTGNGFNSAEVLRVQTDQPHFTADMSWCIPKAIRAIRLAPTDSAESFKIRNFSLRSVSKFTFYGRSARRMLSQAASQRRLARMMRRGLKALATGGIRRLANEIRGRSQVFGIDSSYDYNTWIEQHRITSATRAAMLRQPSCWTSTPRISILLSMADGPLNHLRASLDSICRQIYPHWELIVVAGQSVDPAALSLLQQYACLHDRIVLRVLDQELVEVERLNHALSLASGDFTAVVEAGDELSEHALFQVASEVVHHPKADWFYSDEDRLDVDGHRINPFFKPDWSPELALASNYTGQLSAYRTQLLRKLGGWRGAYEGAHHYDLALRAMSRGTTVHHVTDILYHSRRTGGHAVMPGTSRGTARREARQAAIEFFREAGQDVVIEPASIENCFRVRRPIRGTPLVSIVIPTASKKKVTDSGDGDEWYLLNCVRSIRQMSTYKKIEIVVVDNNDMPLALREAIEHYDVTRVTYTRTFNLSAKMNLGAAHAKGDYVVFLNDDIEVITPDWIEGMLEHAQDKQVGAVGVNLLYPSGQIQHAGVIWTYVGPDHLFHNEKLSATDRYAPAHLPREQLAVTGACVMIKMSDYHLVGGWNETMPLNYNDIDLCLKLVAQGRRSIYTPYVKLRHFESVSQTSDDRKVASIQRECKAFMDIWRGKHPRDPYYNPNFLQARAFYRIDTQGA